MLHHGIYVVVSSDSSHGKVEGLGCRIWLELMFLGFRV